MRRVIYHVDVNSAFLSWEAAYRIHHLGGTLDLRTIPSAVGGNQEKRHGIILAKSIPAKNFGIDTGEPVISARRKCPDLVVVPPNYDLYHRSSKALFKILGRYTDCMEQFSIDEAFMDMTGCTDRPEETAEELKDTINRELGFTVNVGVSSNKLLAKMASDFQKPNLVHTLWPEEIPEKMWPLPVRDLFFVGRASKKKLESMGISTIGELASTEERLLKAHLKSHGIVIRRYANGKDESPVIMNPPPNKGYGNSLTAPKDIADPHTAKLFFLSLAETISARLRADGVRVRVISISLRDSNLRFFSQQTILFHPTDLTVEIYETAVSLFDTLWKGFPIRHFGIHTSQVTREGGRQMGIFETVDYEKQKKAEQAIDSLRKRFGQDAVKRACFLNLPSEKDGIWIDHMGGGISREKRTVDYTKEMIV